LVNFSKLKIQCVVVKNLIHEIVAIVYTKMFHGHPIFLTLEHLV